MMQGWFSIEKLFDPSTVLGALTLGLFLIIAMLALCTITTRLIERANWIMGRFKRKVDDTVIRYSIRIKNFIICLVLALFYASLVPGLRALMGTMVAGAGITALVIGFAAKSTLANLISGLSLAVYRPFRIGDNLTIDDEFCTVEDITLRHTIVRTWQYKRLIIPNAKIDEMIITNFSLIDPRMRCTVDFGVSYDTDLDLVRRLILEEATTCPHRDKEAEEPILRVVSHGDFSIGLRLYVWVPNVDDYWLARFWLLEHVKKRFDKEGIEIPFPYRTIVYKKDLPLARKGETSSDAPQ